MRKSLSPLTADDIDHCLRDRGAEPLIGTRVRAKKKVQNGKEILWFEPPVTLDLKLPHCEPEKKVSVPTYFILVEVITDNFPNFFPQYFQVSSVQ